METKKSKFLAFMREASKRAYDPVSNEHFDRMIKHVEKLSLKQFLLLESKMAKIIKNFDPKYGSITQLTRELRNLFKV